MTTRSTSEAFRQLDETLCAYRPVLPLPPADLETRETSQWLEPVRFFEIPCRYSADRPLPSDCPHAIAEALERELYAVSPKSGVRVAVPNSSCAVDTPTVPASDVWESAEVAGTGRGVGGGR